MVGPDVVFEQIPIHVEIVFHLRVVLARRRPAADEAIAVAAHISSVGIDQQRAAVDPVLGLESEDHPLLHFDWYVDAGRGGEPATVGARRIDHRSGGNHFAVFKANTRRPAPLNFDGGGAGRSIVDADRPRLLAKGLHHAIAVEPAFTAATEAAGREIFNAQPRKGCRQRIGLQESNVRPEFDLQFVVFGQRVAPGVGGKEEVAILVKANIRPVAVHLK